MEVSVGIEGYPIFRCLRRECNFLGDAVLLHSRVTGSTVKEAVLTFIERGLLRGIPAMASDIQDYDAWHQGHVSGFAEIWQQWNHAFLGLPSTVAGFFQQHLSWTSPGTLRAALGSTLGVVKGTELREVLKNVFDL